MFDTLYPPFAKWSLHYLTPKEKVRLREKQVKNREVQKKGIGKVSCFINNSKNSVTQVNLKTMEQNKLEKL